MPAVTDEIFEKYLQKAISEINDLGDEIGRAAGEGRVPVLGSGHPLADVFLLKHEPQPAEVQEGVAFFGRAGQAVLKSLQRLHVDPMAIYGTNALKFSGGDAEEARPSSPHSASCSGSRLRSRRSTCPTSTSRSTSNPPRRNFGTRSKRWAPGGRSFLPISRSRSWGDGGGAMPEGTV